MNRKIVITGAPGSGKTVITQQLAGEQPDRFVAVPEAATQVYTMLQTRWDKLDLAGRHDAQRRMYRLQLEQEARLAAEHPQKTLLLDRGTIDGAAYWPEGAEHFWLDVGTTQQKELSRYHAVILLETCAVLGMYDGDQSNCVRFEDARAAIAAGRTLEALWHAHPHVLEVQACERMEEKVAAVRRAVAGLCGSGHPADR